MHGPVLNRASILIDAAIDGQGVALARTTLAASDLISGRLVQPFATTSQAVEVLLDRLHQGDGIPAEDRGVPRLAGRGGR